MSRASGPRGARPLGAALLLLAALAAPETTRGTPLLVRLRGTYPDSSQAPGTNGPRPPRVNLAATLDRGFVTPEEIVARRLGGDQAQTGADFVFRPFDLNGAGRGRTPWVMDGHAGGGGMIHWDNPLTMPLRALLQFGEAWPGDGLADAPLPKVVPGPPATFAAAPPDSLARPALTIPLDDDLYIPPGGSGSRLLLTTAPGPARPLSTVSFTGGDYGSRLGSFNFRRRFGRTAVDVDGASLKHDGWGDFGENRRDQGFARFDFPVGGSMFTVTGLSGSGRISYGTGSREDSKESRLTLDLRRRAAGGLLRLSFLRAGSGLKLKGGSIVPFDLRVGHLRLGGAWGPEGDGAGLTLAGAGEVESRHGVVTGDEHLNGAEAMARWRRPAGAWWGSGRLLYRWRELTGGALEPELELSRPVGGARLTLAGGRSTGLPAIQFHTSAAQPDELTLSAQLAHILELKAAESHWTFGGGLTGGERLAGTVFVGATRTDHDAGTWIPPLLNSLANGSPWFGRPDGFWVPRVDAGFVWRPRNDWEIGGLGQFRGLDAGRQPYETRLRGEGWVTLRRIYWAPELDLAATLGGRYIGSRRSASGQSYPAGLVGSLTVTATVRTLTLFWRLENLGGGFIESDVEDSSGLPIPVPGMNVRIGATLHLMD